MVRSLFISLSLSMLLTGCWWDTKIVYPILALPEASYGYQNDETSLYTNDGDMEELQGLLRTHGKRIIIRDANEDNKIELGYTKCRQNEIYLFDMIHKYNKLADSKMK